MKATTATCVTDIATFVEIEINVQQFREVLETDHLEDMKWILTHAGDNIFIRETTPRERLWLGLKEGSMVVLGRWAGRPSTIYFRGAAFESQAVVGLADRTPDQAPSTWAFADE